MKKLFTIDDIMVASISALGYGYGDVIARLCGLPFLAGMGVSSALGIVLEFVMGKIAFSKAVQSKPINRVLTYVAFLLVFVVAHVVSVSWMGKSMVKYLLDQLPFAVGMPVLGLGVNLLIRGYRVRKIRELYGDGSEGYVFDATDEEIEEANRQNQPIVGDYDADCAVSTRAGTYVGYEEDDVAYYLGIPYAKPPVGELRWKAPEPLPDSDVVLEARNLGASAIQVDHKGSLLKLHRQSEDCLYLNVCHGCEGPQEKRPVMVLFHHGDFTYGGSVDPLLGGDNFVRNHPEVVFVSFNWRLGILGFIDFSEVPGGEAYPDAANLGLLDQIAALRWVRDNIAAFGGDPGRVTLVGFGAGASSISLLAASERARGLFQRAFVFHGCPEAAYGEPSAARALAAELMRETNTQTMAELARLDTSTLRDATQRLWLDMCAPTCDGGLIPLDVYGAYRDRAATDIEFIVGIPGAERLVLRSLVGNEAFDVAVSDSLAEMEGDTDAPLIEELRGIVEAQNPNASEPELRSRLLERYMAVGVWRYAARLAEAGYKVRLMYWDEEPLIANLGSGTVDAAATLLGNGEAAQLYGNVMNDDLSEVLQALLAKFVCGDALRLYTNEVKGMDALVWEEFPQALAVAHGELQSLEVKDLEELCSIMRARR